MNPSLTEQNRDSERGGRGEFAPTAWTVIVKAQQTDSPSYLQAMDGLCRAYWYPVYAYIRRRGYSGADAQDCAQELLSSLITPAGLANVDRQKGRFRSYLLGAVKNLLAKRSERQGTVKRGGGAVMLAIDETDAEGRYLHEPQDLRTPEALLDYCWAQNVLSEAVLRLKAEYERTGRLEMFEELRVFVDDSEQAPTYEEVAARQGKSLSAVKSDIRRFRLKYGQALREVVGETVSSPEEIDAELTHLLSALSERGGSA